MNLNIKCPTCVFITLFACYTSQSQGLKLIMTGTTEGLPRKANETTFHPMPDGHFIVVNKMNEAYAYDFKWEKDMVIDEAEAKRINKGKPDPEQPSPIRPEFPRFEIMRDKLIKYDPYKGIIRVTNTKHFRIEKSVNFKSLLKWHLVETNDRWSTMSNGMGGELIYGYGNYKNLNLKLFEQAYGGNSNAVIIRISDKNNPNMIPKQMEMGTFYHQLLYSPELNYYAMIRWYRDFVEIAYYATKAKKYAYYYLKGKYKMTSDPFKGSFLDNLGNLYLYESTSGGQVKIYNPAINPATFYSQISSTDGQISKIKSMIDQANLREDLSLGKKNLTKVQIPYIEGGLSLDVQFQGSNAYLLSFLINSDQSVIHTEKVTLGPNSTFILNPYTNEVTGFDTKMSAYKTWSFDDIYLDFLKNNPDKILTIPNPYQPELKYKEISDRDLRIHKERHQKAKKPWPGDEAFRKKYREERAYRDRIQQEVSVSEKISDGQLTGYTINGIREGYWDFKGNDGTTESWNYNGGYRIDPGYKEIESEYNKATKEIQKSIYASNLTELLETYQKKVEQSAAINKVLKQVAVVAGGSVVGQELGMDQMNALDFGVALNKDIQNGTTSNLDAFLNSYQSMSPNNPNFLTNLAGSMGLPSSASSSGLGAGSSGVTGTPGANGTPGSGSLIGTWTTTSGNISITFQTGGKGVLKFKDANNSGTCLEGTRNEFNWTSTDSTIELIYTSASVCGEVQKVPKSDGPKNYKFEGSELKYLGATWMK